MRKMESDGLEHGGYTELLLRAAVIQGMQTYEIWPGSKHAVEVGVIDRDDLMEIQLDGSGGREGEHLVRQVREESTVPGYLSQI